MEEIVDLFNTFRSNIVVLQDLKTALHAAEIEIETLNARLKSEKKTVNFFNFIKITFFDFQCVKIEPRMRVSEAYFEKSSELTSPTRLKNKNSGLPISSRRITNWIDINPAGLTTVCFYFSIFNLLIFSRAKKKFVNFHRLKEEILLISHEIIKILFEFFESLKS